MNVPDPCSAISPGHSLYGLSPFSTEPSDAQTTHRALRAIKTRLISVRDYDEARQIGVGGTRRLIAGARIGVLPIGRADGLPRPTTSATAEVRVGEQYAPVLGVSLEHTVIDLSGIVAEIDQMVWVVDELDSRLCLDAIADSRAMTALDLLLSMGPRIQRVFLKD